MVQPAVADKMNDMLHSVVEYGTGRVANVFPKVWGKTGTTQDDRDAWFIGFTPELTTTVWAGNDRYTNAMHSVHGGEFCGGAWVSYMKAAVPLMQQYHQTTNLDEQAKAMAAAAQQQDAASQAPTVTVKICTQSHLLARSDCPHTAMKTYPAGTQPTKTCTLDHSGEMVQEYICPISGKLATPYCPNPVLKSFPTDSAPVTYCDVHKPPT